MLMVFSSLLLLMVVSWGLEWFILQFWTMLYSLVMVVVLYMMGDYLCFGGFVGGDSMSGLMILLTFWLCGLMMMASQKIKMEKDNDESFSFLVIFMGGVLFMVFGMLDLFWFYIFFELVLIPTLLMILGWGFQPERLQAGMYMLFYTMVCFFTFISGFDVLYMMSWVEYIIMFVDMWFNMEGLWILVMMVAFLVKLPMFMLHLWLPSAHVEAPVAGSIILAGVLFKLGGYGLYRFMNLFYGGLFWVGGYMISLCLIGGVVISFICMCQVDLKSLIAYSSVSHMGILLGGYFTFSGWGMGGGLVMMLAHGLCSSGLFCLVNMFYERLHTRSLMMIKGMMLMFPSIGLFWFLLSMGNMASPPSINLLGEIMLMISMIGWSSLVIFVIGVLSFMSVGYTIYMYSSVQHGKSWVYYGLDSIKIREYLMLFCHLLPMNYMILFGSEMGCWM
uniref:NADH-ubiquinone oxidoreductase chain 4 n=1 Tax=Nothopuga sp. 1 LP-2008 TaxID=504482 RepID=A9LI69_9ARAC|nr:NADH dehydrogenase subunit 4 [Nothopuga sp. 1 LP-2008]ABS71898.1 NADH dehydrogenase subunit 4 [Nothopuga sp. 1 LP-2008]